VRGTGSDAIEYVRQTAHTNNAAPVPEATSAAPIGSTENGTVVTAVMGGRKPQGSWAFERETTNVKTIAEWVPASKRALADVRALEGLIDDELRRDVAEAEEDQILNGDGTGENLLGVLNTPGTQGQLFDTDLFTTARRAITKARIGGRVNPTAFLFNPEDDETIDLARENGATGKFVGGGPFGTTPNTLWGIPRASSEFIPAGTFVLADWTKVVLWDREQTQVSITDSHEDYFVRNLVAILAEERVALATVRPSAVVVGDARA
jgi:HK97 family phage major capsid protein